MFRLPSIAKGLFSTLRSKTMSTSTHEFVMDAFALRQFNDPNYTGTRVKADPAEFEAKVNEYHTSGQAELVDGYAPFCKHLFVPNFCNVKCGYVAISEENKHLIKTDYEARTEKELPVLVRYFDTSVVEAPTATHLDIILYSREQIMKENEAMGNPGYDISAPWGIISVKGQNKDYELPMQPITMLRNSLGKAEGGSGVPIVRGEYNKSVAFWRDHVSLK